MSAPPKTHAGFYLTANFTPLLAQTSDEVIELARVSEIKRLSNGGEHIDRSADFTLFVMVPIIVLLGIVVICRRMMP